MYLYIYIYIYVCVCVNRYLLKQGPHIDDALTNPYTHHWSHYTRERTHTYTHTHIYIYMVTDAASQLHEVFLLFQISQCIFFFSLLQNKKDEEKEEKETKKKKKKKKKKKQQKYIRTPYPPTILFLKSSLCPNLLITFYLRGYYLKTLTHSHFLLAKWQSKKESA